jgi:hypothetical protein
VVSFTPLPLYPPGKSPLYSLDRRLGGPQSRSGRCGEAKYLALPGIEPGPSSPYNKLSIRVIRTRTIPISNKVVMRKPIKVIAVIEVIRIKNEKVY